MGAALGAMIRAAYQAMAMAASRIIHTSAWGWYRQISVSAAKAMAVYQKRNAVSMTM